MPPSSRSEPVRHGVLRVLILVPLGLIAAIFVGFAVALVASMPSFDEIDAYSGVSRGDLLLPSLAVMLLISPVFLGASFAIALIAEAFAIRSWIFHTAAGAAISLLGCRLFGLAGEGAIFTDEVALGAGLAAGLTYWLIAGRGAGFAAPPSYEVR